MAPPGQRRSYETDAITVRWDSSRCIHTGNCLQALPRVFDTQRRPWVDVAAADADAVAAAVERCPTGALRYERRDGRAGEVPPRPTTVVPIVDGPLVVTGDLDVRTPDGEQIAHETRLALCRCGMSRNQPFCDSAHLRRHWRSDDPQQPNPPAAKAQAEAGETTRIVPRDNASLEMTGDVRVYGVSDDELIVRGHVALCRCGHSANKPFCDGSHATEGFGRLTPRESTGRGDAQTPADLPPNLSISTPRVPRTR